MLSNLSKGVRALLLIFATIIFLNDRVHGDVIYDVAADFSIASNPNGAWTYGTVNTPGGTFVALNTTSSTFLNGNFDSWLLNSTFPSISLNTANTNQQGGGMNLDAGKIGMHPGSANTRMTAVRWTAPSTGSFDLNSEFEGRDNQTMATTDVFVVHNGAILSSGSINNAFGSGSGISYSNSHFLNAGDTIDFVVGNGGDGFFGDSTGLAATLTSVPEPSSSIVLLVGSVFLMRRRSKS